MIDFKPNEKACSEGENGGGDRAVVLIRKELLSSGSAGTHTVTSSGELGT